jgi:TetR/AcrR family transcriptional regulator, transcriptional repressor of bet genes
MSRVSISTVRRAELQRAAYEVVCRLGFNAATVEDVARHAGASKGMVHHYFDSKHHLLEYATRYAMGILGRAARERLRKVKSPSERLWAIIEANFAPEIMNPQYFRLWFEGLDDKRLRFLFDIIERRNRSNLEFALKQLMPPRSAPDAAYAIMNLYDGYWILVSIDPAITRQQALAMIAEYICELVPNFDLGVVDGIE